MSRLGERRKRGRSVIESRDWGRTVVGGVGDWGSDIRRKTLSATEPRG